MAQPTYTLDAARRTVVRDAVVTLCRDRGWELLALHVRTNHVHVVLQMDRDVRRTMNDLKARASRDLTLSGFEDVNRRRWTRHGSTIHLLTAEQVTRKVRYTLEDQGTPMAIYDGRTGTAS